MCLSMFAIDSFDMVKGLKSAWSKPLQESRRPFLGSERLPLCGHCHDDMWHHSASPQYKHMQLTLDEAYGGLGRMEMLSAFR